MNKNNEKKEKTSIHISINKFLDVVIKKRKIFNIVIIALSFITFAVALIGAFDAIALKYAIGFSVLPFVGAIVLAGLRFQAILKAQQFNKPELIWHSIMVVFGVLTFIFWIWSIAASVASYDAIVTLFKRYKEINANFTLVVITGTTNASNVATEVNEVLTPSLLGSLWAILVTSCGFLFSQTLYNVFARIPNQI